MDPREYRKQVEAELRRAPQSGLGLAVGARSAEPTHDWLQDLGLLADHAEPAMRRAALQRLQSGTFLGSQFAPFRAAYVRALRAAATSDDAELRHAAMDVLANAKDAFARQRLLGGLQGTEPALVSSAVALGLLARDDHGSASNVARSLLEASPDVPTREQAARLLAVDPGSAGLLSRLMRDKTEVREVRRASAVALRSLDRGIFEEGARSILADDGDFKDIKATVQGALDLVGSQPMSALP